MCRVAVKTHPLSVLENVTFGSLLVLVLVQYHVSPGQKECAPQDSVCAVSGRHTCRNLAMRPRCAGADWLNAPPLRLDRELRGRVVVLDFWTYCCINYIHVLPALARLERKYEGKPVTVVGVHSAKFTNEKDSAAVRAAVLRCAACNLERALLCPLPCLSTLHAWECMSTTPFDDPLTYPSETTCPQLCVDVGDKTLRALAGMT